MGQGTGRWQVGPGPTLGTRRLEIDTGCDIQENLPDRAGGAPVPSTIPHCYPASFHHKLDPSDPGAWGRARSTGWPSHVL